MTSPTIQYDIRLATTPADFTTVRTLFTAYSQSLPIDLAYQNFAHELASLPGAYSFPDGIILLAFASPFSSSLANLPNPSSSADPDFAPEKALGCVALRPLRPEKGRRVCEMKRLYTIPTSRGTGVGKALATAVINWAREAGYAEMRLDTLPSMVAARGMYGRLGFIERDAYYESPVGGTVFMSLKLGVGEEGGEGGEDEG